MPKTKHLEDIRCTRCGALLAKEKKSGEKKERIEIACRRCGHVNEIETEKNTHSHLT